MQAIHRANILLSSMVRYGCAGYGLTTVKNCESSGDGGVGGRLTMFSCVTVVVNGTRGSGRDTSLLHWHVIKAVGSVWLALSTDRVAL